MGVILAEDQIDRVLLGAETALDSYVAADGRGTFRLSAHLVTATKPWQVADAGEYGAFSEKSVIRSRPARRPLTDRAPDVRVPG